MTAGGIQTPSQMGLLGKEGSASALHFFVCLVASIFNPAYSSHLSLPWPIPLYHCGVWKWSSRSPKPPHSHPVPPAR